MNNVLSKIIDLVGGCYTIYDIGAHEGSWTRDMSSMFPNIEFVMFEAFPEHSNIHAPQKFQYINVPLHKEDDMELSFYINTQTHHTTGNSFYKENTAIYNNGSHITLKTKKLDTVISEQNLPQPDVLKIDTQGAELDILLGTTNALRNVKVVMCELSIYPYNAGGAKFSDVNDFLIENGFVPVGIEEFHWNANVLLQVDMVYLRREINEKHFPHCRFLK